MIVAMFDFTTIIMLTFFRKVSESAPIKFVNEETSVILQGTAVCDLYCLWKRWVLRSEQFLALLQSLQDRCHELPDSCILLVATLAHPLEVMVAERSGVMSTNV